MKKRASRIEAKKKKNLHKAFVKILLKSPITNLKFSKNGAKISFNFFNHKVSDRIRIRRVDHVAEWSRRRKEIFIDKKFGEKEVEKSFRALCLHEALERFLVKEFGLNTDNEAHIVASHKEKEYLKSIHGNWKSHELKVFWDWHKMGEH